MTKKRIAVNETERTLVERARLVENMRRERARLVERAKEKHDAIDVLLGRQLEHLDPAIREAENALAEAIVATTSERAEA
jgi:hypothetical protein